MGFADNLESSGGNTFRTFTDYIRIDDGTSVKVQFLNRPEKTYIHWFRTDGKYMPIRCPGFDECPVCTRNNGIENRDEDPDYIPATRRGVASVVDLTPVKRCPECGYVNDRNSNKCSNDECERILVEVDPHPLGEVRYVEGPKSLFDAVSDIVEYLQFDAPEDEKIFHVPVVIKRSGTGRETRYTAVPQNGDSDAVDPSDFEGMEYSLFETGIHMDYDELVILMNGGSFSAIMEARRGDNDNKDAIDEIFSED